MRNITKDIKEWVDENKESDCAICFEKLFTSPNARSITYLDCCWNTGKTKGHGFHGRCMAEYLSKATDYTDIDVPAPYLCPFCRSQEPFVNYPEMRQRPLVLGNYRDYQRQIAELETSLQNSHQQRRNEELENKQLSELSKTQISTLRIHLKDSEYWRSIDNRKNQKSN